MRIKKNKRNRKQKNTPLKEATVIIIGETVNYLVAH